MWLLVLLCPAVAVGLLAFRAGRSQSIDALADYHDIATVLEWFVAPLIVVTVPLLARQPHTASYAGIVGIVAILLFYSARAAYYYGSRPLLAARMRGILASSGAGLGVATFLAYTVMNLTTQSIIPGAGLYIWMIWSRWLGRRAASSLVRGEFRLRLLEPGDLLTHIRDIGRLRGVTLDRVMVVEQVPGRTEYVNAFAVHGREVWLTADLIAKLPRQEVDAVIEHEIGHIRDERLWTLDGLLNYGLYISATTAIYLGERYIGSIYSPWHYLLYVVWAMIFTLPEFARRLHSRTIERRADEEVGLLADPMSAVSGYYRLAFLNHLAINRPLWSRLIQTHSTTAERITAIAKRAGLTREDVERAYIIARQDVAAAGFEMYRASPAGCHETPSEMDYQKMGELARRWDMVASPISAVLTLLACVLFVGVCMCIACITADTLPEPIPMLLCLLGIMGCIPIVVVSKHVTLQGLRGQVQDKLRARYGDDVVSRSLLLDAVFPGWVDREHPWQGTLLFVSDGQIVLLGEVAELRIPVGNKMSIARWSHSALFVAADTLAIAYEDGGLFQQIIVRPLGIPKHSTPRNCRELILEISRLLGEAAPEVFLPKENTRIGLRALRWSSRIPIAIAILLLLLAVSGYLAETVSGGGWASRIVWCGVSLLFAGPCLWYWVTLDYKPNDGDKSS